MPKLSHDELPTVKLDSAGGLVEVSLTAEQRRGLFEQPGTTVVAIVELSSVTYTGHASGEEKPPQVKLRASGCEVARTTEEAAALLEAKRAMWRSRRMDGTLDEVGAGPRDVEAVISHAFAGHPTEPEYRAAKQAREDRHRTEFVR